MPIRKIQESLRPTTSKHGVPLLFHEPHVETGFRHLHQPWTYYLASLLQKHNECMNAWTHLVAMLLIFVKIAEFSAEFDMIGDPHLLPLGAGFLTMILLYFCSFFAHCFSNKSELVHYTGFMIDYAGIGLYGFGSVLVHYSYCSADSMIGSIPHRYGISVGFILSVLVCICCSISKTIYRRPYPFTRKVWQLTSVVAIYTWLILPIGHRVFLYLDYNQWQPGLHCHIHQVIWFAGAGFFFSSDIPQRFFPGKFDFFGHSHQLFHVCIMMVNYKQLNAIYHDMKHFGVVSRLTTIPTIWNTYGLVILLIVCNACVVYIFHKIVHYRMASGKEAVLQKSS